MCCFLFVLFCFSVSVVGLRFPQGFRRWCLPLSIDLGADPEWQELADLLGAQAMQTREVLDVHVGRAREQCLGPNSEFCSSHSVMKHSRFKSLSDNIHYYSSLFGSGQNWKRYNEPLLPISTSLSQSCIRQETWVQGEKNILDGSEPFSKAGFKRNHIALSLSTRMPGYYLQKSKVKVLLRGGKDSFFFL